MSGGGKSNPISQVSNGINQSLSDVGNNINSFGSSTGNSANDSLSNLDNSTFKITTKNDSQGGLGTAISKGSYSQQAASAQAAEALAQVNQRVDQFGASRVSIPGRAQTLLTQNYGQPGNTLLTFNNKRGG